MILKAFKVWDELRLTGLFAPIGVLNQFGDFGQEFGQVALVSKR